MRLRRLPVISGVLLSLLIGFSCRAEELTSSSSPAEALSLIFDIGLRLCSELPLEGRALKYTAIGKSVEGLDGRGRISSGEYFGLPSEDLLKAVQNNLECRFAVLEKLVEKLLPAPNQTDQSKSNPAN